MMLLRAAELEPADAKQALRLPPLCVISTGTVGVFWRECCFYLFLLL